MSVIEDEYDDDIYANEDDIGSDMDDELMDDFEDADSYEDAFDDDDVEDEPFDDHEIDDGYRQTINEGEELHDDEDDDLDGDFDDSE